MKEVFYRLRKSGSIEQVPNRNQAQKAWYKLAKKEEVTE